MVTYMDNMSYESVLNMPSDMRGLLTRAHNAKIEKIKEAQK